MSQTRKQHAYQRGIRAARLWQRLKGTLLRWDRLCVSKARERKLPGWTGHIPVSAALLVSVTAILLGGAVIAGCLLFIQAIAFILQNVNISNDESFDEERASGPSIRHGNDGYGYYTSSDDLTAERMD